MKKNLTRYSVLLLCSFIIFSCQKDLPLTESTAANNTSFANAGAYKIYASVYKLDAVGDGRYNYEINVWVSDGNDSATALPLPGNLRVNLTIQAGSKTIQYSTVLKKGSYITHEYIKLRGPVSVSGNSTVPDAYNGRPILFASTAKEKIYNLLPVQVAGEGFIDASGKTIIPWGVNYTNTNQLRLVDDNWLVDSTWEIIKQDFREMKALEMNVIRIHLQYNRFMLNTATPNQAYLNRLKELADFSAVYGMYLDVTGLGAYILEDAPTWYDALNEDDRWATQAVFWKAVAQTLAPCNNIFDYNLMNEPVTPSKAVNTWVAGEPFGGYYFVQYLTQTPRGRTWETVTRSWTDILKAAIREVDTHTPITIGFIGLGNISKFNERLDYNSIHIYPEDGKIDEAVAIIQSNQTNEPLVVEETNWFGGFDNMRNFIHTTMDGGLTAGYLSHYHGETIAELEKKTDLLSAIQREWYAIFCFELNPNHSKPQ